MDDSAETLPRLGGGHVFDGWTTLAAMAKTTKSVRLGLLSPSAPFHNAALLAKRAASLDVISDGRFRLALRADGYLPEYAALGFTIPGREDRRAARHQRDRQRPAAPVLPERHRPVRLPPRGPRLRRRRDEPPPTQTIRLAHPRRGPRPATVQPARSA